MPDRILREGLLTSESWLALKNNDDRVCWLTLFLHADTFGNQPAGPYRLIHLWRHAGIDTPEKVAKVLSELADVDLARPYAVAGKPYVHLPRFDQSRRFLGKLWPVPPWASDAEKQAFTKKSRVNHKRSPETHQEPPQGVGVGVGVGKVPKHMPPAVAGFDSFWIAWPKSFRKGSRVKCLKVWSNKRLDAIAMKIIAHVEVMKKNSWRDEQYVPAPLVYLNQDRWDGAEDGGLLQTIKVDL